MIEISQIAQVAAFSSTHYVMTEFGDGVRHWTLTGIADLSGQVRGKGAAWQREWVLLTLMIPGLGLNTLRVKQWAPFVTLDAVTQDGDPTNAGWAIESFHLMDAELHEVPALPGALMRTATLGCGIKVRGLEGCVLRLGYSIQLIGSLEPFPLQ